MTGQRTRSHPAKTQKTPVGMGSGVFFNGRRAVLPLRVGLPEFNHGIGDGSPRAIPDTAADHNPLAGRIGANQRMIHQAIVGIAILLGGQRIRKKRTDRLGRCLAEVFHYSKGVLWRPFRTISNW